MDFDDDNYMDPAEARPFGDAQTFEENQIALDNEGYEPDEMDYPVDEFDQQDPSPYDGTYSEE